jgi:predicted homoserine dehydrogenase-like protein
MMNAEVDGTVGPILKIYADRAGVILSGCDGDQPGVQANLVRFVRSIGLKPAVIGNIKGLQDRFRNPTTQQGFARQWGQNVHMVTSFADGTKISFEQAIVANAFGYRVPKRGMNGFDWVGHVDEAVELYDVDALRESGPIVDYVVGAKPGPGVFVFATHDDPKQRHYLNLYKLGAGPLYSFYTPYHLCHFEVPLSVARAVLLGDAVLTPMGGPKVDVITMAKRDLAAGTVLDGLGGFDTYGEAENHSVVRAERLLPHGMAQGTRLVRDIAVDHAITLDDVAIAPGRIIDRLRSEQDERWP